MGRTNYIEDRPWGSFENLLEEDYCKVKRLIIKPGQRISYQLHNKRSEHWIIVSGSGIVTLDDKKLPLETGAHIHIPVTAKHRIENPSTSELLIIVEVQQGTSFAEEDIVRFQDDYKRTTT